MIQLPSQFPSYIYIQAHPSVNAFAKIQELNTMLDKFNREVAEENKSPLTEETYHAMHQYKSREDLIKSKQVENYCITELFKTHVQTILKDLPQDGLTYFKCLKHVEQNILHKKLTAKNIIQIAKEINGILIPDGGGVYRTATAIVYDDRIMPKIKNKDTFPQLDTFFGKQSKELFEIWKNQTRLKVWNNNFATKSTKWVYKPFDEKDVKCIEKMAEIIFPNVIKAGMNELKSTFKSTDDCYELAGRIHQIFVKTHPFNDANGRTARILMNIVLIQAGKPPILIDDDEKYTAAVKSQDFVGYIRELALKQPACEKLVSAAIRTLVMNT